MTQSLRSLFVALLVAMMLAAGDALLDRPPPAESPSEVELTNLRLHLTTLKGHLPLIVKLLTENERLRMEISLLEKKIKAQAKAR